jgi:hypothetical protein
MYIGKVPIDMLPEEILLQIFAFYMCGVYNDEEWETLVHVCWRWRSVVFAAPRRLNLQLVCTSGTPARKMLEIWPALPIYIRVYGRSGTINANVLSALEERDRICKVYVHGVSDFELKDLVGAMQVTFPALTDLYIHSLSDKVSFSESFLGGSAPNLRSLDLTYIAVPALPKLLLSSPGLVNLSLYHIPHSGYVSSDAIVDFLSSLTRLEILQIDFPTTQPPPARSSRRPAPPTRIVFPFLRKFILRGMKECLDQFLDHIGAPPLDYVHIGFINSTIFDISRISQWIGRTEMFEAFDQVYMLFGITYFYVMLSSRKGGTGGKMLKLSLRWIDSAWKLQELTLDSRSHFFQPFHLCNLEQSLPPSWANVMENAPWFFLVRLFTATEYIYLSQGVVVFVAPALHELNGTGATEVLPVLRNIFVERLDTSGAVQEAIGQFVATRQLLSSHPIEVQCWISEMDSTNQDVGDGS